MRGTKVSPVHGGEGVGTTEARSAWSHADRFADLAAEARGVLNGDHDGLDPSHAQRLLARLAGLVDEIVADLASETASLDRVGAGQQLLDDVSLLQVELREHAITLPFRALERIGSALDALRGEGDLEALLLQAARLACSTCGFDRALISRLRGSTWVPHTLHIDQDTRHPANVAFQRFVVGAEIPLATAQLEAELVRRRAPALIHDPKDDDRTFRPVVEVSHCIGYVVAPITTSSGVVGFLHGDTFSSGRELGAHDRENVQAFADALGVAYERAVVVGRLRRQHDGVQGMLRAPVARLGALADPARASEGHVERAATATQAAGDPQVAQLTRREREVLRTLALGYSNAQIADELVVAESTVKSHVKHIMRKLEAKNRTEAVSTFLRQTRPAYVER